MTEKKKNQSKLRKPFHIALPATSANLGPAFDAAALALDLYIEIEARVATDFSISATGRDSDICGHLEDHLIVTAYTEVLRSAGKEIKPLRLRVKNNIPIGKGCGSSAAARLAGIALAVHFGRLGWKDFQIIGEAARRERHPDNASACWMGGLTVARMRGESETEVVSIRPKGKWPLLLAVPKDSLSTEKARSVLPSHYPRADAVANVQNSMFLLAAFMQGRPQLLSDALEDRIHQPYRAALCPLLPCVESLRGNHGILGAALSGAGPSVLIFLDPLSTGSKVRKAVAAHLAQHHIEAELLLTSITARGARNFSSFKGVL